MIDRVRSAQLLAQLPSTVTKLEFVDGRLMADTEKHGRFEITDVGAVPVTSPRTSKKVH